MYKALQSFTTKNYDIHRTQILEDDFTTQEEIQEFLNIGYIVEYDGTIEITENGEYDVKDYEMADVNVSGEGEKAVLPDGIKFQQSTSSNMDWLADVDTSQITSFSGFFRYCKQITSLPYFDTSNGTNFSQMCENDTKAVSFPQIDTSNGTNFNYMFMNCKALVNVPVLDWSKATALENVFGGRGSGGQGACTNLSNESLNNILEMCINATAYIQQGTNMTLSYIGLTSTQATTCQSLSNWNDFVEAGWTSGY